MFSAFILLGMSHPTHRKKNVTTVALAMKAHGYSDQRLADEVGIHRSQILRLRHRGFYESLRKPKAIADRLGVSLESLAPPSAA